MKRKVDNEICHRELRMVERSTENIIENGLGAAYRLQICIGYEGSALYSARVSNSQQYYFVLVKVHIVRYE